MMRKKIILIFLFIIGYTNFYSQTIKFEKVYGGKDYDYGYSVVQAYDKGYIVAGVTTSFGSGGTDAYILKTDSLGNPQWHRTYGGINIDHFYSIKKTFDFGYILAGYTNSFGAGGYDGYLVKIDSVGNTIWSKTFGGTNWDFLYSVSPTSDSGFVLCGGTYSFGKGNQDMYVIKTNSSGDTIWTKTYGGTNDDIANSIKQTSDGGYILTGTTKSLGDTNGDVLTIKTNNLGDTLWTQKYGGNLEDTGDDVIESVNGLYMIVGSTQSGTIGDRDGLIIRYSLNGNFLNDNFYGGLQEDKLVSIVETSSSKFSMMGYTYSWGWGNGTPDFIWYDQNSAGGNYGGNKTEKGYCISNTEDGGFIICGYSNSYTTLDHIYLIKTDSNHVSSANVIVVPTTDPLNVNEHISSNFSFYPNPVDNFLNLHLLNKLNLNYTITLTDFLGRELINEKINNTNQIIDTSALPNGMYLISLINENSISTKKILIQH